MKLLLDGYASSTFEPPGSLPGLSFSPDQNQTQHQTQVTPDVPIGEVSLASSAESLIFPYTLIKNNFYSYSIHPTFRQLVD